ncbi:GtrA family protein [Ornithinicoccus halotolerans]|uniref:GtrA family protein n=1 Tax=Ornithinicoccus halotolerans TaxID=1748220 RepID=UPI001E369523|nr:GtrA family protein [Ornithinicoccus halotolerans]
MTSPDVRRPGLLDRLRDTLEVLVREAAKFGTVGLVAFVVDLTVYNLLVFGVPGDGVGAWYDVPLRAKAASVAAGTVVAWLGNRYWTFRRRRRAQRTREFALFVMFNALGLGIALACLGVSRYLLGLDSQLADNVSANGVGLVLGTLFRFWAYRRFVFRGDALADIEVPLLHHRDREEPPAGHGRSGTDDASARSQRAGAIDT